MADYKISDSTLTDIADSIRAKTGSQALIYAADFADEITNIPENESTIFLINDSDWSTSGLTYEKTITIEEAGDYQILWSSYSDQPTIKINGVTQAWTYSQSSSYAWFYKNTATLAVGDTISFSLSASGNTAFIAQVLEVSLQGDRDDPLGIMADYSRYNIANLYSCYNIETGAIKKELAFQLSTGTGYEGFCVPLDNLGLTAGKSYKLSFILDVPTSVTFSGSYAWGIKHSSARVPASGSATGSTFNLTPTVDFLEQTGTQDVSITFTATSANYLVVLLARLAASQTQWIKMRDIQV